mgnify:FL=1
MNNNNSKVLLDRFGKRDILFDIATTLCTERVVEPEKSRLLRDKFNFGELILEIETIQPIGIFRKKNFFFDLNEENLKEAKIALEKGEIGNWFIRINSASERLSKNQLSQTV